jgi:undecaprenyl-diphosphatase
LRKSEVFFADHGGKSVFLGRFIGLIRPFIPFVAGQARMAPLLFTFYAVISGILWGLAYPGLGYFFGASWHLVELWAGRFSYFLAALIFLLILNHLFWKRLAPKLWRWAIRAWHGIAQGWQSLLQTGCMRNLAGSYPEIWKFVAGRFSLHHGTGLYLTSGFAGVILFASLFIWIVGPLTTLDHQVYQWVARMQHPTSDVIILILTYFGNAMVIVLIGLWACLWLLLNNRYFSAVILVGGTAAGELFVYLLKLQFERSRPESYFPNLVTAIHSFPSAHAFVALVFYGLLVYMLLNTLDNLESRFYLVIAGSALTLLIGFSRLYLGVHWFSDILGGFALAAAWLTILITACEMRLRHGGEFPWRFRIKIHPVSRKWRLTILALTGILLVWSLYGYIDHRLHIDLQGKHIYNRQQMG